MWRTGLTIGILAAATAIALVLVTVLPGQGPRSHPRTQAALPRWARALSAPAAGFVISSVSSSSSDASTYTAVSDPGGGHAKTLKALGQMTIGLSPALDYRFFVGPSGEVLSFGAHGTADVVRPAPPGIPGIGQLFGPFTSPLADHDRYVILVGNQNGAPGENQILLVPAAGKHQVLGTGDNVAGDPATEGVFTSMVAPIKPTAQAPPPGGPISADGNVVLRDAGKRDVVLATAPQLLRALHARQEPVALYPAPDPAGDVVAVVVQPTITVGQPAVAGHPSGIVVLSRTGRVVAALGGLTGFIFPDWSPDGRSFAFVTDGSLRIWTAGGKQTTQKLPPAPRDDSYDACTWSPDGARILCALTGPKTTGTQWVVAAVSGGPTFRTRGPGYPVAWLPPTG